MNLNQFTIKSQEAIQKAQEVDHGFNYQAIESIHLMKGDLDTDENVTPFLLKKLNVNFPVYSMTVTKIIESLPKVSGGEAYLLNEASEVLLKAQTYLKKFGDEFVAIEHLLLSILEVKSSASQLLKDNGIEKKELIEAIKQLRKGSTVNSQSGENQYNSLNRYVRNLNEMAASQRSAVMLFGKSKCETTCVGLWVVLLLF